MIRNLNKNKNSTNKSEKRKEYVCISKRPGNIDNTSENNASSYAFNNQISSNLGNYTKSSF